MVAAIPLPFSPETIPATLEDFPPEARAAILEYEAKRAAGTWVGVPHEEVTRVLAEMQRRQAECQDCCGVEESDCARCGGCGALCKDCGKGWGACVDADACGPEDLRLAHLRP